MDSPGSISDEYRFPSQYICDLRKHRDEDFVFEAANNGAYFPIYSSRGFNEKPLTMGFSFDDNFSRIENKYYKVFDKTEQINDFQGLDEHTVSLQEKQNLFEASVRTHVI